MTGLTFSNNFVIKTLSKLDEIVEELSKLAEDKEKHSNIVRTGSGVLNLHLRVMSRSSVKHFYLKFIV